MCHPGFVDDELRGLDSLTTLREREYAFLAGEMFAPVLAAQDVVLARPQSARRGNRRPLGTTAHGSGERLLRDILSRWSFCCHGSCLNEACLCGRSGPMTPEERRLVTELFDRLATLEDAQRDPEAERLVKDGLRQAPNAPYALVQTALVQDEALRRANARIRELEGGAEAPPRDTSFLGSMRDTLLGSREARGSVPSVRPGSGSAGAAPAMSPAWRVGTPSGSADVPPMQAGPAAAYGAPGPWAWGALSSALPRRPQRA